jgi:hypothetical protein
MGEAENVTTRQPECSVAILREYEVPRQSTVTETGLISTPTVGICLSHPIVTSVWV